MSRLLLLSNSRNPGGEFLAHATDWLRDVLGDARTALFFPYAGVRLGWDDYAARVRDAFDGLGVAITSAHEVDDLVAAVEQGRRQRAADEPRGAGDGDAVRHSNAPIRLQRRRPRGAP